MTPEQIAEARSRAYALLAGLWIEGLTDRRLAAVQQTPLAAALPAPLDRDRLAAEHHQAWMLEIFPYAGVFLDSEDTLGAAAQEILTDCHAAGFRPRTDDVRPDHLGLLLAALSFLSGAEADARDDHQTAAVDRIVALQEGLLARWVVSWLPPFWLAAAQAVGGFWFAMLETTAAVLLDHQQAPSRAPSLPAPPTGLLAEAKTSLWRIAGVLATPVWSGVFLTRTDLAGVGRAAGLPRGFGARQQMLANLLRSAAEYQQLPQLVARLDQLWVERVGQYQQLAVDHPALKPCALAWAQRAEQTRPIFNQLRDAAVSLTSRA